MVGLDTPLCRMLRIRYPILSVGFGRSAGPELAAAVSNSGGAGVIGCSGLEADHIGALIARTRELTALPFGVNLIIDSDETDEDLALIRAEVEAASTADFVVLFWGDPGPYVELAHARGAKLLIQVGSVDEARGAVEAGVDAVIAQGLEAGGHVRSKTSIWELLPQTVEAAGSLPVLASGGIGNGEAIARALRSGAQGVSLGTRFVASEEAWIHETYKQRVTASTAEDTLLNELYDIGWPNAPHRTLRNKTFDEWDAAGRPPSGQRPGEGTRIGYRRSAEGDRQEWLRYAPGMLTPEFEGDIAYAPMWAGMSVSEVRDVKPAAEIVGDLVRETEAALAAG